MFMNILTAGLFTFAFTACSDDIENDVKDSAMAQIEIPAGGLDLLEQHSYAIPYKVEADGDWKISFSFNEGNQICYALPDHGHGAQEIKICVLDNWTDERRTGEMTITDMDAKKELKVNLAQKCNLDNGLTTRGNGTYVIPDKGNRIYGVGYGYNEFLPTNQAVSISPIIKLEEARNSGICVMDGVDMMESYMEATGSTFHEMTNDLKTKASASGKGFGFEAEASAAYNRKDFSQNKNEYALCRVDVTKMKVHLTSNDLATIVLDYMCDDAYNSISGVPVAPENARSGRAVSKQPKYPNTDEGFYDLVKTYGTHLIISADMGGRVTYANTIDVSKLQGSYDINAFAKCSYSNIFMKASGEVSEEYKKSFENNRKAVNTIVSTYGGTQEASTKVANGVDGSINAWKSTLEKVENCKIVGVDQATLIPLWKLVNTAEEGGAERQRLLKEFIETKFYGMMQSEQAHETYVTGAIAHLKSIPAFPKASDDNNGATLIKDVYMSGMHVARVCNEFIPLINKQERVTVIYPVIENNVKYNLGYWIGDANRKPCRICCTDNEITVREIESETKGVKTELYMRGSSFYNKEKAQALLEGETAVDTKVEDFYLKTNNIVEPQGKVLYDYPVVKVFSHIWTRENYGGETSNPKATFKCQHGYYNVDCNLNFNITNWRSAMKEDFQSMADNFQKAGITSPIVCMYNNSNDKATDLAGFNLKMEGWKDSQNKTWKNSVSTNFLTKDKNGTHYLVELNKTQGFLMRSDFNKTNSFPVRVCCPVSMQK